MRITYVIRIMKASAVLGGHYRSLKALAECMLRHGHDCHIVTISCSQTDSPVLRGLECPKSLVLFTPRRPLRFVKLLRQAVSAFDPEVVHCFDLHSFFQLSNAMIPLRHPTVLSKCGGPVYRRFHPAPDDIVLFSTEDMEWFRARREYAATRLHHIPNRVAPVHCDPQKCEEICARAGGRKTIIRVCRIGSAYEQSIRCGAELVRRLRSAGVDIVLVVVGVIESQEILDRLVHDLGDSTIFVTEDRYCKEGAAILYAGDLICGTGRGFMEGASLGKPLLVPIANSRFPALATEANFDSLFRKNFSPRAVVSPFDEEANVRDILACLTDRHVLEKVCADSQSWYRRFFSIEDAYDRYLALYHGARPTAYRLSNHLHCIAGTVRSHLSHLGAIAS